MSTHASSTPALPQPTLSPRERQVLARMADGQSNKHIALELGLSPHTVKRHVANLFDKLDLMRRSQATAWYYLNAEASRCCRSGG